jgi:hypothetical protein
MRTVPEIIVGKSAKDWNRADRWSVPLAAGFFAFWLSLLPWIFRSLLFPGRWMSWPAVWFFGMIFALVVAVLVARRLPSVSRKSNEDLVE